MDDDEVKGPDESQFTRAPVAEPDPEQIPDDLKGPGEEWDQPTARAAALPSSEEA